MTHRSLWQTTSCATLDSRKPGLCFFTKKKKLVFQLISPYKHTQNIKKPTYQLINSKTNPNHKSDQIKYLILNLDLVFRLYLGLKQPSLNCTYLMKPVDTNFNYFGGRNICQQQAFFFQCQNSMSFPLLLHTKRDQKMMKIKYSTKIEFHET